MQAFVEIRSLATPEGPQDALCQLKSCQLLQNYTKKLFEKACNMLLTLNVT